MALRAWPMTTPPLGVNFQLNRASPQAAGLAHWWPVIGSVVALRPERVKGMNGVKVNTPGLVPSVCGWGMENTFSSGHYYDAGAIPGIAGSTAFTIVAQIRRASSQSAGISQILDTSWTWYIDLYSDGVVYIGEVGPSYYFNYASAPIATTTHIAAVYNGAGATNAERLKIYVNGVSQSISTLGTIPASIRSNLGAFRIGKGGDPSTVSGMIGDVRIYNRDLSAAEVWAMYAPQTRWQLYGVPVARRGSVLSAVFRRTLSEHGTRIGSRQVAA